MNDRTTSREVVMPVPQDIRCPHCQSLLARRDAQRVTIQRNKIEITVTRPCQIEVLCYRCAHRILVGEDAGR
jgi:DNA-directed RNA polymerase subunit RPC12/RpoP